MFSSPFSPSEAYLVTQSLLPEEPRSRRLMTSDQDTKVVAEPQVQQVQEAKENSHLVSFVFFSFAIFHRFCFGLSKAV